MPRSRPLDDTTDVAVSSSASDTSVRNASLRNSSRRGASRSTSLSDVALDDEFYADEDFDFNDSPRSERTRNAPRPSTLRDAARRAAFSSSENDAQTPFDERISRRKTRVVEIEDEAPIEYSQPAPKRAPRTSSKTSSATSTSRSGSRATPRSSQRTPPTTPPRALAYEVVGVLALALSALLLYNSTFTTDAISGAAPKLIMGTLRALFGMGSIVVPLLLGGLGVLLIARHHRANLRAFSRGAGVAFFVLLTALHLRVPEGKELAVDLFSVNGGAIGGLTSWILRAALGPTGAIIFLAALSLVALLFWSELSLAQTLRMVRGKVSSGKDRVRNWTYDHELPEEYIEQVDGDWTDPKVESSKQSRREQIRAERLKENQLLQQRLREASALPESAAESSAPAEEAATQPLASGAKFMSVDELLEEANSPAETETSSTRSDAKPEVKADAKVETAHDAPRIEIIAEAPPVSVVGIVETPVEIPVKSEDEMTPTEKLEAQALASATDGEAPLRKPLIEKPRRRFGEGPLMPHYFDDSVRALDPPVVPDVTGVEGDIHAGVEAVQNTLASFKIDARVTDVKRGPVITRYEVQPAPGVRVASIANLDRDMSRALSAIAVRIEAPVPGKDVVGIEVPNKKVHLVRLRDVLERHDFLSAPSKLAFVLGKDIAGQPKWADLTKMPHMLVAGATNSGKSVCLNTIITSIICRASPDEVKFSLIDPKRVELTLYKGIPHLYHDVVVEPKDAVKVLRGMIAEMDRRYKRFAERGVRNIVSYNQKLEEDEKPLPYIVIVIDELADLMMTAAAEFEKLICRLAQLARATGIHLIVATQRPSVNVITGVIKANIPSRIAFAVASQVDSRTILDSVGAERLIGSGDMLFDANNGGKAIRIQGAFLSEEEVNRIVDVVKAAYAEEKDDYEFDFDVSSVTDEDVNEANEKTVARDERKDDLYDEILEYVVRNAEMSASMIQRKFEIGYPRAARIVDQFERDGVLSPANGSKPRKVIGNGKGLNME